MDRARYLAVDSGLDTDFRPLRQELTRRAKKLEDMGTGDALTRRARAA